MILNGYYNDVNKVLIVTTTGRAITNEQVGDVVLFKDAEGTVIGLNAFNVGGLTPGFINVSSLPSDILAYFETSEHMAPFVYGFTEVVGPHPDSDKLQLCTVDLGFEKLQIVCGASNCRQGMKVVVARVGAVMPNGMSIVPAKVKGVESFGMLCSTKELGILGDTQGIILLEGNDNLGCEVVLGDL